MRSTLVFTSRSLALLCIILVASTGRGVPLTIWNPSFEAPVFSDGAFAFGVSVAQQGGRGWNFAFDGGFAYNPQAGDYTGAGGNGTPQGADGAQVGGVYGGDYSVFQTLAGADGVTGNSDDPVLDVGMVYTLTFEVGQRAVGNPFAVTYGGYNVELLAGVDLTPTILGGQADAATPPPPGSFVTRSIVLVSPTIEHQDALGQPLTIRLRKLLQHASATTEFDNVRLDALKISPELNADFDEDEDIDGADLAAWTTNFGAMRTDATHEHGNANGDDFVDGADFLRWQRQLGSMPAVAATTAVPEPASAALLVAASFVAAAFPRRRSIFFVPGVRLA